MTRIFWKLYYKYKLGTAYDKRVDVAERFHHAISDFTCGGRGHNIDMNGTPIRANHKRVRMPAVLDNPLIVKYPRA